MGKSILFFSILFSIFFPLTIIAQYSTSEIALSLIYLNPLITPENKDLAKYFNALDFASIIQDFSNRTDEESVFYTGLSWLHMLNFKKAKETLKQIKGTKFAGIAANIIYRIDAVINNDKTAYETWIKSIEKINNSMARSERAFMRSIMEKRVYLEELASAYRDAIKEYDEEKIDCLDIQAFNYILFLKDKNLEQAHVELNKVVKYDFALTQTTMYYDSSDLKLLAYPIVRLLSEVLYRRAIQTIESLFRVSIDDFLKMEDKKRSELVLQTYIKDRGTYNSLIYYLENSLNVLILGRNNYYFVQSMKEPSTFFEESAYGLNEKARRLLMYVKLN
ncbi:MAG: hypothetical protein QW279_12460 [Candidatus Jordarchaeaceae archaeon]